MYESGEKLFGLTVASYPMLHQRKKEFNLLSKLYSLYLLVVKKVDGYLEIPWFSVDVPEINTELLDFQLRCRKLPKDMQLWPAYIDLKVKIDDFSEICPVLELMKSKAIKDRHWVQMETLMDYQFDIDDVKTTLGKVTQAPLLNYKDDLMVWFYDSIIFIFMANTFLTHELYYSGHLYWCGKRGGH